MSQALRFYACILLFITLLVYGCKKDEGIPAGENQVPVIKTSSPRNVSRTTASVSAKVIYSGADTIIDYGICWNIRPKSTISDRIFPFIEGLNSNELGASFPLKGLSPGTTYYARGYGMNKAGIGYGNEVTFTTLSFDAEIIFNEDITYDSVTDVEGNVYKTIVIGSQTWMAENLRTTRFADDTPIPLVEDSSLWDSLTTPAYCWYNNNEAVFGTTYGALYNFYTVLSGKICPAGWHVPTDMEWKTLEMEIGMSEAEANSSYTRGSAVVWKLVEPSVKHWYYSSDNQGINETGFSALPAGQRMTPWYVHGFIDEGYSVNWWTATMEGDLFGYRRGIRLAIAGITRDQAIKYDGLSIRCIK